MTTNQLLTNINQTMQTMDRICKVSDIIYLSGPMTGLPGYNRDTFNRAKRIVAGTGATVISPADLPEGTWEFQLRKCIRFVSDCTKILMLPGWENSKGALLEHLVACQLVVPRFYLEDNLLRASQFTTAKMDVTYMTRFMEDRLDHNAVE